MPARFRESSGCRMEFCSRRSASDGPSSNYCLVNLSSVASFDVKKTFKSTLLSDTPGTTPFSPDSVKHRYP